jgi:hypothetical protein
VYLLYMAPVPRRRNHHLHLMVAVIVAMPGQYYAVLDSVVISRYLKREVVLTEGYHLL